VNCWAAKVAVAVAVLERPLDQIHCLRPRVLGVEINVLLPCWPTLLTLSSNGVLSAASGKYARSSRSNKVPEAY
jgi:hypothetical protein